MDVMYYENILDINYIGIFIFRIKPYHVCNEMVITTITLPQLANSLLQSGKQLGI